MDRQKRVRLEELGIVSDMLLESAGSRSEPYRIVEIGGGSGFLAKEISSMGAEVVSVDPTPRRPLDYPVVAAFGHELPLGDQSADRVFAAHVLEHIPERFLGPTFQEIHRVLKPEGRMIVLLPSSFAMIFTIMLQPLGHARNLLIHVVRAFGFMRARVSTADNNPLLRRREPWGLRLLKTLTIRWVLPAPHGVGKTALHEIWNWRRSRWIAIFSRFQFTTTVVRSSGLAVSNHQLFGASLWSFRKLLGTLGMAGTNAFGLQRALNTKGPLLER
jgi:SAM-dependent methyltransferase